MRTVILAVLACSIVSVCHAQKARIGGLPNSTMIVTNEQDAAALAALAASGTLWRAEWQAAAGSSADVVRAALASSGTAWRAEWQAAAGSSAEVVRSWVSARYVTNAPTGKDVVYGIKNGQWSSIRVGTVGMEEVNGALDAAYDAWKLEWELAAALAAGSSSEVVRAALAIHTNRTDNPHAVTAVQIGAATNAGAAGAGYYAMSNGAWTALSGTVGPQGPTGANGTNAYVTITNVVTLAAGSAAWASNNVVGGTNNVTLGIPAGANGAAGASGPAGEQGPAGIQGLEGPQGPQGPAGASATNLVLVSVIKTNEVILAAWTNQGSTITQTLEFANGTLTRARATNDGTYAKIYYDLNSANLSSLASLGNEKLPWYGTGGTLDAIDTGTTAGRVLTAQGSGQKPAFAALTAAQIAAAGGLTNGGPVAVAATNAQYVATNHVAQTGNAAHAGMLTNSQTGVTLSGTFTATGGNVVTNNGITINGSTLGNGTNLTITSAPAGTLTNGNLTIGYSNNMLWFNVPLSSCTGFVFNVGGTNIMLKQNN